MRRRHQPNGRLQVSSITFSSDPAGTCTTHDNTATFTTNDSLTTDSADQSVQVCVGEDLQVAKSATPTFTRTYSWNITKVANPTSITQDGGSTANIGYTVKAWETGFVDSAWKVTGSITVTNPNDWESVSLSSLTDSINNGGVCTLDNPLLATSMIAPLGTITATYTCTYTSAPSPAGFTNTATAAWDPGAAFTPDGSAQGTAGGSFGTPTKLVNQTVTIVDTYKGTLGTLTATNTMPYTSGTYTYTRSVTIPAAFSCSNINNTATITETGQSASATGEAVWHGGWCSHDGILAEQQRPGRHHYRK